MVKRNLQEKWEKAIRISQMGAVIVVVGMVVGSVFSSCKEEKCQDPWNPECENYNPCLQVNKDYEKLEGDFQIMRDSCLKHFVHESMSTLDTYENTYKKYLKSAPDSFPTATDSIQAAIDTYKHNVNNQNFIYFTLQQQNAVLGASRTGEAALATKEKMDKLFNDNSKCFK